MRSSPIPSPRPSTGCSDQVVGFGAILHTAPELSTGWTELSSGARGPMAQRMAVGAFGDYPALTSTWCNPATATAGRGPLSPVPLFYAIGPGGELHVATGLGDVAAAMAAVPSPVAVAARLVGLAVRPPLTLYREVFGLPAGTRVSNAEGRLRLVEEDVDWEALLPAWSRRDQRALVTEALAGALAELPDGPVALSGGLGSAALAVADGDQRDRVHVRVDVPMLDRRADRMPTTTPGVEVANGTPVWHVRRDSHAPPYPDQCDPWPVVLGPGTTAGHLLRTIFAPNRDRPRARLRVGWDLVRAEKSPRTLVGQPARRAWTRHGQRAGMAALLEHATSRHGPEHLPGWLSEAGRSLAELAHHAGGSHLVPDCAGPQAPFRAVLAPLIDSLDTAGTSETTPGGRDSTGSGNTPAVVALHPHVVGVALRLRLSGRSGRGHQASVPALRDLLPGSWTPVDPPAMGREQLLAADLITHRLARPPDCRRLLDQAVEAGWADHDPLAAVLARPEQRLRHSLTLHRLMATLAAHPQTSPERHDGEDTEP